MIFAEKCSIIKLKGVYMKKKLILGKFVAILSFFFIGCATTSNRTDIDEFYHVIKATSEIPEECRLLPEEEPKIFYASDIDSDFYQLQSLYYYPIGYAGWNGASESVNNIEKNAKKLCRRYGAKVALYSYAYTDTRSGWTQYGSYAIKRYDCTLYLFAPYEQSYVQTPKIGIEWRDLNPSDRLAAQRNTGAYIAVVYEKSPAFYANLAKGDIITEINGVQILDSDSVFTATMFLVAGSPVTMKYLRNGVEKLVSFNVY